MVVVSLDEVVGEGEAPLWAVVPPAAIEVMVEEPVDEPADDVLL